MERSYYAIIPANVRYDENITPNAKLLYGEITALCNEKGYCWATNTYFSELYKVSKRTITDWIKQLINGGYIKSKFKYKEGSKEIEKRLLYLSSIPIEENFNTCRRKVREPIEENFYTPIEENFQNNNTINNNTINILLSLYEELGFGLINSINKADLEVMSKEYTSKWVEEAMKEANEAGIRNLKYVKGILKNWKTRGFKADKKKKGGSNNGNDKPDLGQQLREEGIGFNVDDL